MPKKPSRPQSDDAKEAQEIRKEYRRKISKRT